MGCVGCRTSPGHRGFRPQHHDSLVGSTTSHSCKTPTGSPKPVLQSCYGAALQHVDVITLFLLGELWGTYVEDLTDIIHHNLGSFPLTSHPLGGARTPGWEPINILRFRHNIRMAEM